MAFQTAESLLNLFIHSYFDIWKVRNTGKSVNNLILVALSKLLLMNYGVINNILAMPRRLLAAIIEWAFLLYFQSFQMWFVSEHFFLIESANGLFWRIWAGSYVGFALSFLALCYRLSYARTQSCCSANMPVKKMALQQQQYIFALKVLPPILEKYKLLHLYLDFAQWELAFMNRHRQLENKIKV